MKNKRRIELFFYVCAMEAETRNEARNRNNSRDTNVVHL